MHGGSFAFRFLNVLAAFAARVCRRLGASALIPDYRLKPEFKFPAAPDDCHTAYRWLLDQGCDPSALVLMGDSAGSTLSLVALQRTRRAGRPANARRRAMPWRIGTQARRTLRAGRSAQRAHVLPSAS